MVLYKAKLPNENLNKASFRSRVRRLIDNTVKSSKRKRSNSMESESSSNVEITSQKNLQHACAPCRERKRGCGPNSKNLLCEKRKTNDKRHKQVDIRQAFI
jgi:hypothetical protein